MLQSIEMAVRTDITVSQPIEMAVSDRFKCVKVYRDSFRSDITVPQHMEMAVGIDITVLQSIELAVSIDITVSQPIKKALGTI